MKKNIFNNEFIFYVLEKTYIDNLNPIEIEKNFFEDEYRTGAFASKVLELFSEKDLRVCKNNLDIEYQKIYFGAPGTGKSYELNKESKDNFSDKNVERVTFYPNYSYANFVGTYKPIEENKNITYKFVPGILVRQLKNAYENPDKNYLLIIEEINRANVSAVFGDTFQLLDRDSSGESEYPISLSEDLFKYFDENLKTKDYLNKEYVEENKLIKLYFPRNLYIWATMNSADQGVQPLDTAFKRRWTFEYIDVNNGVTKELIKYEFRVKKGDKNYIKWNDLREKINIVLSDAKIPEDKLMGSYFISKNVLEKSGPEKLKEIIKNKVLMYLYEDVLKISRNKLFNPEYSKTFSNLCRQFDEDASSIFIDEVKNFIIEKSVIDDNNSQIQDIKKEN
ncbi:AAA family ATPase [Streptobacillus felis]|uniref:AAA family ATPase n=1 Tax=Streptobacillus felis TaxID=1384509 RepID=UPI0008361CAD|nr:AAA family ATPase [Streptobacillus felis]